MASGCNVPLLHRHLCADLGLILMFEVDDIYRTLIIMKKNCSNIPVILLPLRPVSLMHKNPQRCKINHGMGPIGWSIDPLILRCFCRIPCSCNFCGCYFIFFCALNRRAIFLFQETVIKRFGVFPQINCLVT